LKTNLLFSKKRTQEESEDKYRIQKPESILEPIWQTPKDANFHGVLE